MSTRRPGPPRRAPIAGRDTEHLPAHHAAGLVDLGCANCRHGAVLEGDVMSPASKPLRTPAGLPPTDAAIWDEVRSCLGVKANVAAVMLCRKLLFHVAVAHGLDEKNDKGWAPSYVEAVEHLQTEGLITNKMRPWVDRIKDVGNDANHELQPILPAEALDVATFTEQLLRLAYEMDSLMGQATTPDETPPASQGGVELKHN